MLQRLGGVTLSLLGTDELLHLHAGYFTESPTAEVGKEVFGGK